MAQKVRLAESASSEGTAHNESPRGRTGQQELTHVLVIYRKPRRR